MSRLRFRIVVTPRRARLLACAFLALVVFVATPSGGHPPVTRFDALPRPSERLARPLWLPHCAMLIVEWRATAALRAETTPSDEALAVLDDTCRGAFERYDEFLRTKRLPRLRARPDELPSVSLLPGNTLLDGKSSRALNDLGTRFEAVAPGCCYWGLYVESINHLFVRNDPLVRDEQGKLVANPRFVRTLTHEISHVLSSRLGVWDAVGYDRDRDEALAEEFVTFMGMRFPGESSADDLVMHRRRAPRAAAAAIDVTATAPSLGKRGEASLKSSASTSAQR